MASRKLWPSPKDWPKRVRDINNPELRRNFVNERILGKRIVRVNTESALTLLLETEDGHVLRLSVCMTEHGPAIMMEGI